MRKITINLSVAFASVLVTMAALETGARIRDGEIAVRNFRHQRITLFQSAYPVRHDPEVGWVPRPGAHGCRNVWQTEVTIFQDGLRSNGHALPAAGDPAWQRSILAAGDSFVFGDQVSDADTWPALLEGLTGRLVLNAGVFGYGFDQAFLRARILAERYRPETLIVGFIPDSIDRSELAERNSALKPYFEIAGDGLLLRNTPVPPPRPVSVSRHAVKDVLGYSYFIHTVMRRAYHEWWIQADWWRSRQAHDQGEAVTCRLLSELEAFADSRGIRLLLLFQYARNNDLKPLILQRYDRLQQCLSDPERVIDLRGELARARAAGGDAFDRLYDGHMTAEGNRLVARTVLERLRLPGVP